jgi:CO dehydrogenase/acetyl-CoA synthase delta subunit
MSRTRRLAEPRRVRVQSAADDGRPLSVGGRTVESIRESWLIEDRWWSEAPLRRRYWEVVTTCGRDLVVFRDLLAGAWYVQR